MNRAVFLCALLAFNAYALEPKHIGIFRQISPNATIETEARALILAQDRARQVQDYYRYFARHEWDIQARGYVMRSNCNPHPPNYCQDGTRTVDTGDFNPNYWHVLGGYSSSWCGQAVQGGYRSVNYNCSYSTTDHEIGHNLSIHHGGLSDGENESEFGDSTTIMGSSGFSGLISPNIIKLGLDRELKIIDKTQQFFMAPTEISIHGLRENEHQNILIAKTGFHNYSISIRKVRGHPYPEPVETENNLYVHEIGSDGKTKRLLPDMLPTDTKILPNGVTVEYLQYSQETARVNIIFDDTVPADIAMPEVFPVVDLGITLNHNGAWYDADFNGQGLSIHVKESLVGVYWYTYDNGFRFYYGVCNIDECQQGFDLYTTSGGSFSDPTTFKNIWSGVARINFTEDGHGVFNYLTDKYGRGSIEITPIALSVEPINGAWYQPDRNGSGLSLQLIDGTMAAYWYTYDTNHKQRWFLCIGSKVDASYEMTIYETSGGRWMRFDDVDLNVVGTATLTIVGDNHIDFEYNLDADGINGNGVFNWVRLF